MALIANSTTIKKLIVNGVEIKKLQVKKTTDTTYTVVFEAGGSTYTGSFTYSELVNALGIYDAGKHPDDLTNVFNEYSKGVVPLFKSGYAFFSENQDPASLIDPFGAIAEFDTTKYTSLVKDNTISVLTTGNTFSSELRASTLAIMKRLNPVVANLKNLLFETLAKYSIADNRYELNSNWVANLEASNDLLTYTIVLNSDKTTIYDFSGNNYNIVAGIKRFIDLVYFPEIDRMLGSDNSIGYYQPNTLLYEYLTDIDIQDDEHISLTFSTPVTEADLIVALSYITMLYPEAGISESFNLDATVVPITGLEYYPWFTGPYQIDSQSDTNITFTKATTDNDTLPSNAPEHIIIEIISHFTEFHDNWSNYAITDLMQTYFDILIANTENDLIDYQQDTDLMQLRYQYQAPYFRIHYLTTLGTNYIGDYKDKLQQTKMDYIAYLNKKINRPSLASALGSAITLSSPLFLPDGYSADDGQYNIQDIISWESYDECYPIAAELTFIYDGTQSSNATIAEIIQADLMAGSLYPSDASWNGLAINEVDQSSFNNIAYSSEQLKASESLYLTSYIFEDTESSYLKLLMGNYLGYLVDSDDTYSIQKGSYAN